jgi:hypothetical protein
VLQDVEQAATLDMKDDLLEADAALFTWLPFHASSLAKRFTAYKVLRLDA